MDGSAFTATLVYNNLAAGSHTVEVTDANGCIFATTANIDGSDGPTAVTVTATEAACGVSNGTLTIGAVTGGTAPYTYSVDGSGFTATLVYNNLAAGSHTVEVTDANGCVFATTAAINNTGGPTAVAVVTTNATCGAANGTLTIGAVTGGTAPYTYSVDGSAFTAILVYNNLAAGSHTVEVTDANGCVFATTATVGTTSVTPAVTIVASATSICAGGSVSFIATPVNGGTVPTYQWQINGITVPGETAAIFTTTALNSNDVVTVTMTSSDPCAIPGTASSNAITTIINPAPTLLITNPAATCAPGTIDLTAASVTNGSTPGLTLSYWSNAAGTVALNNPSAISVGGIYYIKGTNSDGCSTIQPATATINSLPTATISGAGTICEGSNKTLTVTFTGQAPYQLVYTDGTTTFTANSIAGSSYQFTVAPTATTTYTITSITDVNCTNTGNSSSVIIAVEPEVAGIRYPAVTATTNVPLQLTSRIIGNDYTYSWNPFVGLNNSTIPDPIFTYDREMEYLIEMTSSAGCVTVDTLRVNLLNVIPLDESDIFVPKAWSPNNDGHNDKLFPIPVKIRELKFFRVFNRWGQLVFETNILRNGWDGIFKGQPQVMDTYTWTLEAIGEDGKYYKRAGNSVLIR